MASAAALSTASIADAPSSVDSGCDETFPYKSSLGEPLPSKPNEPPVAVHPSRLLPYDTASKEYGVQDLLSIYCNFITTTWPGRTYNVSLRTFLQEVLKRSRSSYPVFQLTLYYMTRVKIFLRRRDYLFPVPLLCGRRVFVACLMIASKYLLDKSLNMEGWCQISGLNAKELSEVEITVLEAMDWRVHVTCEMYEETCWRLRSMLEYANVTRAKERSESRSQPPPQACSAPQTLQPAVQQAPPPLTTEHAPAPAVLRVPVASRTPAVAIANAAPCPPQRSQLEAAVRDARRMQERHRNVMYRRIGGANAPQLIRAALRRVTHPSAQMQHRAEEAACLPTPENSPLQN